MSDLTRSTKRRSRTNSSVMNTGTVRRVSGANNLLLAAIESSQNTQLRIHFGKYVFARSR